MTRRLKKRSKNEENIFDPNEMMMPLIFTLQLIEKKVKWTSWTPKNKKMSKIKPQSMLIVLMIWKFQELNVDDRVKKIIMTVHHGSM
jgi:hypothetical protein